MHIIKPVQQSPVTTPSSHPSDEVQVPDHLPSDARLIITTPRTQALTILTRALGRGEIVTIGSTVLRFLNNGEQFEEGSLCFEALQDGIYQRLAVYTHGQPLDGPPSHYTWGYGLDLGQADHWIGALYDALTPYEQEVLVVGLITRRVLHEHSLSRRTRPSSISHDSTTDTPFTRYRNVRHDTSR